jgi:Phosphodiester glycosidase
MSRRVPRGDVGPWPDGEPESGRPWDQGARGRENTRGNAEQPRYDGQRQRYDGQGERYDRQRQRYDGQGERYDGQRQRYDGQGERHDGQRQRYDEQREWYDGQRERYEVPRPGPGDPAYGQPPLRKARFRRTRRLFRRRSVRVVSAVVALFLVWVMFSVGQAAFRNNGQGLSANLAEWARDHYLGPVVTFGEWLSYNPPPKGGKPSFSLAVPSGEAVTPAKAGKSKAFVPDIPSTLTSLAGKPIAGEGQWRVAEKVNGEPAILATFLRDATYTSEVNGIASIDQRLVKFYLRPGTEDPGAAGWGVPDYVPAGQRKGLLATFNGGFKLDSAGGGFYLNGIYHGSLRTGAASIVYYKDGSMKIGQWGRDFTMNSSIAGVRQNLKLLVDRGKVSSNANSDVMTNWGATLGGGAYVWRSGIGITKDGRIVYVYGSALSAQDLGELLQRAGAVEGMQMDINPAWMKFDYYQAGSHPSDPTPVPLLPTQQPSPYTYYTPSTRDFTVVYAR